MVDGSETFGDFEFGMWEEDCDKAFDHHVVEFRFLFVELNDTTSWNDCKVIRDLGVVKDSLSKLYAVVFDRIGGPFRNGVARARKVAESFIDLPDVIFRQVAGVGARIGEHFVTLVKCLG